MRFGVDERRSAADGRHQYPRRTAADTPTRRATMLRMAQIYSERFADADGRIRATFDVIWPSGWAPHESQPSHGCRPGSANVGLEEAVKRSSDPHGEERQCRAGSDAKAISERRRHKILRVTPTMCCIAGVNHEATTRLILETGAPQGMRSFMTSTNRSDTGSAECPPAALDSRAACWRDPTRLLALARDHLALPAPANIKRHQEMEIVISVARKGQPAPRQASLDGDADLLVKFAN